MTRIRWIQIALAGAGVALGVLAYRVQIDNLPNTTSLRSVGSVAAAWSFLLAGLVAWARRAPNRLGPLMIATSFALLARQFRYSHDGLVFTVFFLVGELGWALFAHVTFAYPFGRVADRLERVFLWIAYVVAIAFPLAILLVYEGTERLRYVDPFPRDNLLLVFESARAVDLLQDAFGFVAYGVLGTVFVVLVLRKFLHASPRARRVYLPLLIAAVAAALWAVLNGILTFATTPPAIVYDLFWWQVLSLIALPLAMLWGLLRARLARVHVGELVVHLEETPVDGLRDEIALALEDPTLELGLWLPERREYVDAAGTALAVPDDDGDRAVTLLEHEGAPLAVLVHDPTLRDEPKLVEAVAAAARLALVNARLHAEVRAQLETVQESRARIVTAADEERRRIERDLHDGAQQRLVALALELRSAQRHIGENGDTEVQRLLSSTADELQVAVEELRELAQGIHPGILTQGGLAHALEALAARAPLQVSVDATAERFSPEVEATAYFVACEALTNTVKHADASKASIGARRENELLVIEVADDGRGGATQGGGSGLRGLTDRVEARGGRLVVESVPGSGTRVRGEIPCAS
ncbi:MAG: histidine kinase [Thermoleophilia bacterium]|nr:histidine kinase [Thermoleophilia bacterium]MDH4340170.1 histidine kinase [Thermoleophilia bacterium]MDH5279826.1 histidine kinase [Thermoleophilia bacterium]